jgi:hypothetical protein
MLSFQRVCVEGVCCFPFFNLFKRTVPIWALWSWPRTQVCQIVNFQKKIPSLGKFWRVLQWKILVYFMAIWYILWYLGILCGHLVYFPVLVYCTTTNLATLPGHRGGPWYFSTKLCSAQSRQKDWKAFRWRSRVARWHIFKPIIHIWVNFGGSCDWRCWYILRPFVCFTDI